MALLRRSFRSSKDAVADTTAPSCVRGANNSAHFDAGSARDAAIASAVEIAEAGRYSEALALVDGYLEVIRDDAALAFARGRVLFEWGRLWEARKWLLAAEALGLRDAELYEKLGWASVSIVGAPAAEAWMRKSVES